MRRQRRFQPQQPFIGENCLPDRLVVLPTSVVLSGDAPLPTVSIGKLDLAFSLLTQFILSAPCSILTVLVFPSFLPACSHDHVHPVVLHEHRALRYNSYPGPESSVLGSLCFPTTVLSIQLTHHVPFGFPSLRHYAVLSLPGFCDLLNN